MVPSMTRSLRLLFPVVVVLGCATWVKMVSCEVHGAAEQVHRRPLDSLASTATRTWQAHNHAREDAGKHSGAKNANGELEKARHEVEADHEAETEETEESVSPVDMAIAWMLIGEIMFVMMIFYVVNYEDPEIQYYAWLVISSTVSIFTAVQMFNGVQGVLEHVFLEHLDDMHRVVASYLFLVLGLVALQAIIMLMAGIDYARPGLPSDEEDNQMRCWSTLLSHMVAFSSIHAGGSLQQLRFFGSGPLASMLAVGVHCTIMFILLTVFDHGRVMLGRGKNEDANVEWCERTKEVEDDIAALSLSFLFIQAVRYALSGILPNLEGLEEPQHIHPFTCSLGLAAVAMAFALAVVSILWIEAKCQFARESRIRRCLLIFQAIAAMAFAWSTFYMMKWQLARLFPYVHPNSMAARVPLALAVSAASFALIFVLDYLEDLDETGEDVDRAIKSIIGALGFLVGFSWEQSFEGAASCLSSLAPEWSTWTKLCQACIVALIVIPAWRKYILKECLDHERIAQDEGQTSKRRTYRKTGAFKRSLMTLWTNRQIEMRQSEIDNTDNTLPSLFRRSLQDDGAHKVRFEII